MQSQIIKATNDFGKWTISGWFLVIVVIIVVYNSTMCLIIILSLNIWPLDLVSSLYEFVRACKFTGDVSMGKSLPCDSYKIITPQEIKYQPTKNEIPRYLIWGGSPKKAKHRCPSNIDEWIKCVLTLVMTISRDMQISSNDISLSRMRMCDALQWQPLGKQP